MPSWPCRSSPKTKACLLPRPERLRVTRRDGASTHTLEVFVVLTIMFVTVASVTNFTTSESSIPYIERMLTTKAQDTLRAWQAIEYQTDDACEPSSRLDELVFDGIEGDHALWDRLIAQKFGPGFDVDLVLDNYDAIYPLHGSGRVVGQSGIVDWWRDDTYIKPYPGLSVTSGTERIRIDAPALHYATLAKAKGEAARYEINFTDLTGKSTRTAWAPTAMLTDAIEDEERQSAASITWVDSSANPAFVIRSTTDQVWPDDPEPVTLKLRIDPAASDEIIPARSIVNVSFPADWRDATWSELGTWIDRSPGHTEGDPFFLVAEAGADTDVAVLELDAFAPPDPVRMFDVIPARLSHGSIAQSNLVVTYPVAITDRGTPRALVPTAPYGMRAGETFVFGAAFANGGDPVRVTELSITIPGGYDLARHHGNGAALFEAIGTTQDPMTGEVTSYADPPSGWSVSPDGRRVVWRAVGPEDEISLETGDARDLWVGIRLTSDKTESTSIQPIGDDGPSVTLRFSNGYETTSRAWGKSPGIVSFQLEPAQRATDDPLGSTSDGYPWSTAGLAGGDETWTARSTGPAASTLREGSYAQGASSADAANLENAMANATFEVKTRKVPAGSIMRVDGDLTSLLAEASQLGVSTTLALELYSPPMLGCVPTASWTLDTEHMPTPAIVQTLVWDGGLAVPSVFLATDDNLVYRLDATGGVVWRRQLSARATSLEPMVRGIDTALLIATQRGEVLAIDPATGEELWTHAVAPVGSALARFDASRDTVIATAGTTIMTLDPDGGGMIHTAVTRANAAAIGASSAGIFVSNAEGFSVHSETLATLQSKSAETTSFLANDHAVFVARLHQVLRYSADGVTLLDTIPIEGEGTIARGTSALVTDDAVADLALGLDDGSVVVLDGTTGALRWRGRPPYTSGTGLSFPLTIPPDDSEAYLPGATACVSGHKAISFLTDQTCAQADPGGDVALIAAGRDLAALGLVNSYGGQVTLRHADPGDDIDVPMTDLPSAIGVGPWLANEHAVALGTSAGSLILIDDAGQEIFTSQPSDRAGRFSFYMAVPEGGFYGTQLLVARLAWEAADGTYEACLSDWFEVVARDGEPVPRPAYRISFTVAARDTR